MFVVKDFSAIYTQLHSSSGYTCSELSIYNVDSLFYFPRCSDRPKAKQRVYSSGIGVVVSLVHFSLVLCFDARESTHQHPPVLPQ